MHRKGRPVRSQALRRADRCEIVRSGDTVRFGDSSPAAHVHTLRRAKSWGTARAGRCTHGLHQAALEAAGDHPGRPRPEILRNLRPVRAEERPALRRHLGQGLAAVPRLRRLPAAGREVRRTQARAGPAPGDQPEQRPVPEERLQLLDEQLATVTRRPRTTSCPMPSSPSQG